MWNSNSWKKGWKYLTWEQQVNMKKIDKLKIRLQALEKIN